MTNAGFKIMCSDSRSGTGTVQVKHRHSQNMSSDHYQECKNHTLYLTINVIPSSKLTCMYGLLYGLNSLLKITFLSTTYMKTFSLSKHSSFCEIPAVHLGL